MVDSHTSFTVFLQLNKINPSCGNQAALLTCLRKHNLQRCCHGELLPSDCGWAVSAEQQVMAVW